MTGIDKRRLGLLIQERRRELGLSQRGLAERLGVREAQTVSRWETGRNEPQDLAALADALDMPLTTLVHLLESGEAGGHALNEGAHIVHQVRMLGDRVAAIEQTQNVFMRRAARSLAESDAALEHRVAELEQRVGRLAAVALEAELVDAATARRSPRDRDATWSNTIAVPFLITFPPCGGLLGARRGEHTDSQRKRNSMCRARIRKQRRFVHANPAAPADTVTSCRLFSSRTTASRRPREPTRRSCHAGATARSSASPAASRSS